MLNLQSNALKFTPKDGRVDILVKLNLANQQLVVKVKDTGLGIKDEDKPKLFKLFGFLTNTKEVNADVVGLGLYICKKIANKLGGDVSFESEFRKGTTFTYTVPLEKLADKQDSSSRLINPKQNPRMPIEVLINGLDYCDLLDDEVLDVDAQI